MCAEGKHHKNHFPTSGSKRTKEPLDLVHSDVCGKVNAKSLGGAEYFLMFIDDFTHYTWVYVLKKKSDVFKCFIVWKALVENCSGKKLKILHIDSGGEYVSSEFDDYLKSEGIRHERTIPKTPEQNGISERMNRTVVEAVRSMLADAKLPYSFWAEAVSTAVYLRNRSPTKALKDMTPFEAWTKEKPKIEHLRVFGCDAYALIPKDERAKFESKSRKSIFVGYGESVKGYRLYDPNRAIVFYSRNVLFNEKQSKVKSEPTHEENKQYVKLEIIDHHVDEVICDDRKSDAPKTSAEPILRQSQRERRAPDVYGNRANVANSQLIKPNSVKEALASSDRE